MNSENFNRILERNCITQNAFAKYLGVPEVSVAAWSAGTEPIPSSVADTLLILNQVFEASVAQVNKLVQQKAQNEIRLLSYSNEDDFFEYGRDAEQFRTVELHRCYLKKMSQVLTHAGFKVQVINFDRDRYLSWIKQTGSGLDSDARARWLSSLAVEDN